jgi:hypothetical protein
MEAISNPEVNQSLQKQEVFGYIICSIPGDTTPFMLKYLHTNTLHGYYFQR